MVSSYIEKILDSIKKELMKKVKLQDTKLTNENQLCVYTLISYLRKKF